MKVLALDQSSRVTGYAIFEDSKLITSGTFVKDDERIGYRLNDIKETIESMIEEYGITHLVFEDIQLQQQGVTTYRTLAEVLGVCEELAASMNIPYTIVPSVTWKSTLGIKGKARPEQKRNAQAFVVNTYGLKVSQDTADAICIGTAFLQQNKCAW